MRKLCTTVLLVGSAGLLVLRSAAASTPTGDTAALVLVLDWLLFAGMAAVILQMPGIAAYRYIAGLEWWRALWTASVSSLVGGIAYGLTYLDQRPGALARSWWVGLGVLLAAELPVLWLMNREIRNRRRLLVTAVVTISGLYAAVTAVAYLAGR